MSAKAAAQTKATKPAGEELKDAIKRQVEFYFSRANLANDAFLVSQMNSQMYVPIETIIGFAKIKQLTDSVELLVESILDSKVVVLNETKDAIKPNVKSERNTIILREIPSATKPEEVQAIFDGCGEVLSVRSDVGDTWFVTLASEDEAVKTLLALRNKTFNDAPIKARLKSENVLKSFYPATSTEPAAAATTAAGAYARGYYATGAAGYYDMPNNYGVQYASSGPRGQYNGSAPRQGSGGRGSSQQPGQRGGRGNVNTQQPKEGRSKSGSFDQQQQPRPASRKAKDKKAKAAAATSQNAAPAKKAAAPAAERQPVLNSANFPPLPVPEKVVEEIKFKYAHEDILEIVKHMDENDCKLPEGKMDFDAHAVALTPIAHPDLLRNQRTYSIEQAREALRQGRPIRSDSIGSIDYESMMYGEDYTKEARELRKQAAESGEKKAEAPATSAAAAATPAAPAAAAAPKVLGYAAAVILGTPAPQPPLEAKKKPAAAAATTTPAAPAKAKGAKPAKDEAKKSAKKGPKSEAKAAVVDDVPKAGAWGGRAFSEVVKAEPVNPPPAPVKAAAPAAPAAAAAPANGKKIPSTPSGEWVKDKTFKDRRQTDKQ